MVFASNSKKRKKPSIGRRVQKQSLTYARFKAARDMDRTGVHLLPDPGADLVRLEAVPGVDLVRLEAVQVAHVAPVACVVARVVVVAPEDVPQDVPVPVAPEDVLKAVPASDALFSSGSPLPKMTAELSIVDISVYIQ